MEQKETKKYNERKIRPVSTGIITTADVYTEDELSSASMIDIHKLKNHVKLTQRVLSVGTLVKYCEVGDIIELSPTHYLKPEVQKDLMATKDVERIRKDYSNWTFPEIEAFGQRCLYIDQSDISFVYLNENEKK